MFPVKYEHNSYILFGRNSVFIGPSKPKLNVATLQSHLRPDKFHSIVYPFYFHVPDAYFTKCTRIVKD
jgi:hypothetical protein